MTSDVAGAPVEHSGPRPPISSSRAAPPDDLLGSQGSGRPDPRRRHGHAPVGDRGRLDHAPRGPRRWRCRTRVPPPTSSTIRRRRSSNSLNRPQCPVVDDVDAAAAAVEQSSPSRRRGCPTPGPPSHDGRHRAASASCPRPATAVTVRHPCPTSVKVTRDAGGRARSASRRPACIPYRRWRRTSSIRVVAADRADRDEVRSRRRRRTSITIGCRPRIETVRSRADGDGLRTAGRRDHASSERRTAALRRSRDRSTPRYLSLSRSPRTSPAPLPRTPLPNIPNWSGNVSPTTCGPNIRPSVRNTTIRSLRMHVRNFLRPPQLWWPSTLTRQSEVTRPAQVALVVDGSEPPPARVRR